VIRSTFLHLPGVGPLTEVRLWREGIVDWVTFLESSQLPGISDDRRRRLNAEVERGESALKEHDGGWFARRLPPGEHWRLYPAFRRTTAFLDIETTSLSPYEGMLTAVTVHGAGQTRTFVADDNLEELPAHLQTFQVLVTFNGIFFDVPFLRVRFPSLIVPPAHIDLRFVLRRLGYTGGLKRIEQALGLGDRTGVEGLTGLDAVRLWNEYRRGDPAALERLVRYNRADTVNLQPLLVFAVEELKRRLLPNGDATPPSG
jgi:uncharacterized protein YprB with RNaseH-like and TPR domain